MQKLTPIPITTEQVISVNQAIFLLEQSNSDHAEQCVFYLKQLRETMRQAKTQHE